MTEFKSLGEKIWHPFQKDSASIRTKYVRKFIWETLEDIEGGYEGEELLQRIRKRAGSELTQTQDEDSNPSDEKTCAKSGCGKWFTSFEKGRVGITTECGYQYRKNSRIHLCPKCKEGAKD